jgi:hypothetical protein
MGYPSDTGNVCFGAWIIAGKLYKYAIIVLGNNCLNNTRDYTIYCDFHSICDIRSVIF